MTLFEAKNLFIEAWGSISSQWGINKTMAQVHALLMISMEEMSTEDIMEKLSVSRGNANMNLRDLINWGLVRKVFKPGERREFFVAEKDVWKIAKQIAKIRKAKELDPVIKLLEQLKDIDVTQEGEDGKQFYKLIVDVHRLTLNLDKLMEAILKADESWFWDRVLKLLVR
ncbi:MAG: transcriptional regulator [Chitinophagales bacterium]|nr:transcriptional regulator [Chitinophagales bacterium]